MQSVMCNLTLRNACLRIVRLSALDEFQTFTVMTSLMSTSYTIKWRTAKVECTCARSKMQPRHDNVNYFHTKVGVDATKSSID